MASKLAELFVQITGNAAPLSATLSGVRSQLAGFGGAGAGAGSSMFGGMAVAAAAGAAGVAALGFGIQKALKAGSDLNETINKTGVIFGTAAPVVSDAADAMASKFGIVKTEYMDLTSTIGNLLINMGKQSEGAAAATAVQLTTLAADAGSIFNVGFADAAEKIGAALRGESEPISAFGIDTQEAAVKAEGLRMGMVAVAGQLSMQDRVMARSSLIVKGLAKAQGDLANTAGGYANSTRALWGRVTNTFAALGQALLPAVEGWLGSLNTLGSGVQDWTESNKARIAGWAATVSAGFSTVGSAIGQLSSFFSGLGARLAAEINEGGHASTQLGAVWEWLGGVAADIWETIGFGLRNFSDLASLAGIRAMEFGLNVAAAFKYAGDVATTFAAYIGENWYTLLGDAFNAVGALIENLGTNFRALFKAVTAWFSGEGFHFEFTPLLEGFQAAVAKFPEIAGPAWADVSDQANAVFDSMNKTEADHLKAGEDKVRMAATAGKELVGPPKPGAGEEEGPEGKKKAAKHSSLDEFAKSMQEGIFGKDAVAKEQLAVAKDGVNVAKEQLALQRKEKGGIAKAVAVGPK